MSTPRITGVELAGHPSLPLLVVGPSLGTGVARLWAEAARRLGETFHVIGWNLPGHDGAPPTGAYTMADLATGVRSYLDGVRSDRGDDRPCGYAGVSVGGAVGLQLLLDAPDVLTGAVLLGTGATIGEPAAWRERAATVRAHGTPAMVTGSTQRWFAPGFLERDPRTAAALLDVLRHTDAEGYAQVCEAIASFDIRERLAEITAPVLTIAGASDTVTPPASLDAIGDGVRRGRRVVLGDVGHLAPAEAPGLVAALIRDSLGPPAADQARSGADPAAGMAVRRAVLGDAHVDQAIARTTDITRDFQDLITRYAWGHIWTRPGLTRRDRSIAVLTALIAGRHFEELEFHLLAARRNGLSPEEIIEVLLQSAVYLGVPAANTAFAVADRVLTAPQAP